MSNIIFIILIVFFLFLFFSRLKLFFNFISNYFDFILFLCQIWFFLFKSKFFKSLFFYLFFSILSLIILEILHCYFSRLDFYAIIRSHDSCYKILKVKPLQSFFIIFFKISFIIIEFIEN
jgi:hypothetical protein